VDGAVEHTFPASEPPSTGGVTRIAADGEATEGSSAENHVLGTEPDENLPDVESPAEPSPGDAPPDEGAPQGDALK
jgi:hypothetical protein